MNKFYTIGIFTSILLVLTSATALPKDTLFAQSNNSDDQTQANSSINITNADVSTQSALELVSPHLKSIASSLQNGNISKALDQARLIEAQLYSLSLNKTTEMVGNTTQASDGTEMKDYSYWNIYGEWCYVDQYWIGFDLWETTYCY